MPKINTYTNNTSIEDNDKLLTYDTGAGATKLTLFSTIKDWMLARMAAVTSRTAGSSDDVLTVNNGTVGKSTMSSVAKNIVEDYSGTSLAGSSQSVKAAIDALDTAVDALDADMDTKASEADLNDLKDDLDEQVTGISDVVFQDGDEIPITYESEGYKLNSNGYRVLDAAYKLVKYRVRLGAYVRVDCDHIWQFQTTRDVPASGTQYIVGPVHGVGNKVYEVPVEGYVVASTPISGSTMHVYKVDTSFAATVRYDTSQTLTETQKQVARANIGATNVEVDDALSIAGKAADAAKTGDKLTVLRNDIEFIGDSVYTKGNLELRLSSNGYRINAEGYRIADADYKLDRYRVLPGQMVKVVSDDRWQFQSITDVPTSGTQNIIGEKHGVGTFFETVPEGAGYVVLSTLITGSGASANKLTSNIDSLNDEVDDVKTDLSDNELNFSAVLNAYTSQVSDIPYPWSVTHITIGLDTANEKFVSGSGHALVIPIVSGTSIRVEKPQTDFCQICFTSDYPTANVDITHRTNKNSVGNTEFVAESQAADNYLVIYTHSTEIAATDCTFSYSQTARGTVELLPQLDKYMVNLLKYRPVGKISKPYIAISCDDGLEPLATYTLPRIQYWNNYYNTNIPLHMALFDQSPVLLDPTYTALVTDMCENHNCSIGIHGTQPYTVYSSPTALYAYIKKQESTIIEKTGVTPTSVLYPHNAYTDQIMVMSGAFCGICAIGSGTPPAYKYVDNAGRYFYVGEKTNLYEVNRFNISDTRIGSVAELKNVIDYAYDNNYVICPYFHDIDFTEHSEEANQFARTMFDALIQYGMEKGIEFINFGDIRYLT